MRAVTSLFIPIAVVLFPVSAMCGIFGPSNYDDCVLENMKGVTNDVAARAIMSACRKKFPSAKKEASGPWAQYQRSYDSDKVGAAAGRYFGMAVAADYFFERTKCANTRFGVRKHGSTAQQFVYNDIRKVLRGDDKKEFEKVLSPSFISSVQNNAGEAILNIYKNEVAKTKDSSLACRNSENQISGMLTLSMTEFYSVTAK